MTVKVQWTNEALDAAATALNGRGYSRYSNKARNVVRDEMRRLLDSAVAAQGIFEMPPVLAELVDHSDKLQEYVDKKAKNRQVVEGGDE